MNSLRTITAVGKKDLIQYIRYPTWALQLIIWPLIFPLIYILSAVGMIGGSGGNLDAFQKVTGTDSFMGFIVIGTMVWMWVNSTMWGFGTYLREEQTRGTLESNWLCPINKFNLLVGGAIVPIFESILMTVISIFEYRYIYGIHFTGSILSWILIFLIMTPGIYGLGSLFASLVLWVKETNSAVHLVRGTMMILCGITFPISIMPGWMQYLSKALPFTFGISAARTIMINGGSLSDASSSIIICLIEGFILLTAGRLSFRAVENKVRTSGSLERF